jgi:hypothetical protein
MNKRLPLSKRITRLSLEDTFFDEQFFEYDATEDPEGEMARVLMTKAEYRAEMAGLSLQEWRSIHWAQYLTRQSEKVHCKGYT